MRTDTHPRVHRCDGDACAVENVFTERQHPLIHQEPRAEARGRRVAFQYHGEDDFTAAVQRLARRPVVVSPSGDETASGVAREYDFLKTAVGATRAGGRS
jgi:hypothetical protein